MRRRDGKPYSKQAYISLRAGLQRHLSEGPWFTNYVLVSDPAFKVSNDQMIGIFKWLAKQGLDTVNHHDIEQLKATNIIGTDNPLALQRLVWLGVALHYARRGRENYRSMTKNTFVINTGSDGRRFMEMAYCEKQKITRLIKLVIVTSLKVEFMSSLVTIIVF